MMGLRFQERAVFQLRALYDRYGYSHYRMSKFEEYDLYARNKDFLISDGVITFMDTNGKLMALKPDVTLSIVKNTRDDAEGIRKLYYHENVYRSAKSTRSFQEITQVGLECLGRIDSYCLSEVLTLAAGSLQTVADEWILDISHLGFLTEVMAGAGIGPEYKDRVMKAVGEKNRQELTALCRECGISDSMSEWLRKLVFLSGPAEQVLPQIRNLSKPIIRVAAVDQLMEVVRAVEPEALRSRIRFDFSVVDDINYYNGLVFKGYVNTLPTSVLTGGQYDRLMAKMGRDSGAIGFAVYMDALEILEKREQMFDVDTLILYDDSSSPAQIGRQVRMRTELGEVVLAQRAKPENLRCRQILRMVNGEVTAVETDA